MPSFFVIWTANIDADTPRTGRADCQGHTARPGKHRNGIFYRQGQSFRACSRSRFEGFVK